MNADDMRKISRDQRARLDLRRIAKLVADQRLSRNRKTQDAVETVNGKRQIVFQRN